MGGKEGRAGTKGTAGGVEVGHSGGKGTRPEENIPLDEEFQDF